MHTPSRLSSCLSREETAVEEIPLCADEFDALLSLQKTILELIGEDADRQTILDTLCRLGETLLPHSIASIMLVEPSSLLLNVIAAPAVPQEGIDALQGLKPGPCGGSCGNAVFHNEPVFVRDTFTDERWHDLRQLAYDFNLRACWSMPIRDESRKAIGSFALSSFEHRLPSTFHKRLLEIGSFLVGIVLRRDRQSRILAEKHQRLRLADTAIRTAFDAVIMTDENNRIITINKAAETTFGYGCDEVIGKNPKIFASGLHDEPFYKAMWQSIHATHGWTGEIWNKRADGEIFPQQMSISAIDVDPISGQKHYLAVCTDLSQIKQKEEQLHFIAYHDRLTGLYNTARLQELLALTTPAQTLILLNIDNFSAINTAYGYDFGDKLLIAVSDELAAMFGRERCFRMHADQFAVYETVGADPDMWIGRIRGRFAQQGLAIDETVFHISFSMGGASGNEELFRNADIALHKAKWQGNNQAAVYNPDEDFIHREQQTRFIQTSALLRDAIRSSSVVPFFQGIYDNRSQQIVKYEALARIVSNGDILSPALFLGPAKLAGLLPELTRLIVTKSFEAMRQTDFPFSVNITEADLALSDLLAFLLGECEKYGIGPGRVTLEILEGISAEGKQSHQNQLAALKQSGFKLALDDFGAEYSNFERIIDLDIDFIKIDAKYIKNIDRDPKSRAIVEAIVFFAKKAKIPCVAEFVHSHAVQHVVAALGIEYSQGYLFSQPAAFPS